MADAQSLADALKALHGWRLQPPQSEVRQDRVNVTIRLDPQPAEEEPKG